MPYITCSHMDFIYGYHLKKIPVNSRASIILSDDLDIYIRNSISSSKQEVVSFVWNGDEPLLAGIPFYEKVVSLQQRLAGGRKVHNVIHTTGLLLDVNWCAFLKSEDFSLWIGLDGPPEVHDAQFSGPKAEGRFYQVMEAVSLVQIHGIPFTILCQVGAASLGKSAMIYDFFAIGGYRRIHFGRAVDAWGYEDGLESHQCSPVTLAGRVPRRSVGVIDQHRYDEFMGEIFHRWARRDVGKISVLNFGTMDRDSPAREPAALGFHLISPF